MALAPLRFGAATSSFQIEGATTADGRGPSIWDIFCAQPGRIADASNGDVACDSYHRWPDDLDLLRRLGVSAYRFSIAWPRVQPGGQGPVNSPGLDYYERIVDDLLAAGIRPFPTLYHWDLPQELEDAGGWPVRETAERFGEYAALVGHRLGDRDLDWATFNEPWCSAFLGYGSGVHAPGRREPEAAYASAHHLLLAHTLGRQALTSQRTDARVGIVLNLYPVLSEEGADPDAVDVVDAVQNRIWLDSLAGHGYPETLTRRSRALTAAGVVRDGDLAAIAGSADWVGLNYYTVHRIAPGETGDGAYPYAPAFSFAPREPMTDIGWEIKPDGMTAILRRAAEALPEVPLRVTENGAAFADQLRDDQRRVDDVDRIDYLRAHINAVEAARTQGVPVSDYFAWSLMDNFEWAEGYRKTFGIVSVDPSTRDRIPKRSFDWYAERIASAAD